jgi:3-carboxy-cis,cis-muconate cycloisomerase
MDSALAMQLAEALAYIETLVLRLGSSLARLADEHRATLMVGRTHAQHAVPITLGSKFAVWLSELSRHLVRLRGARSRAATVQLFGAAGTAAALGPASRETRLRLAKRLELSVTDVPWQSARDTLAEVAFVAAALSATCGKIGREVIELSRPEIAELQEREATGRGASSTMPQKRNPITSEAIVAMSVQAIHQVPSLLFAMQGGHERAAGEWQIEWDALPTAISLAGASVVRACEVIEGIQVFPERMRSNAQLEGDLIMAEKMMMALAPAIGRTRAHEAVYEACLDARANGMSLTDALEKSGFSLPATEGMLEPESYLGEADEVVTVAVEAWREISTD